MVRKKRPAQQNKKVISIQKISAINKYSFIIVPVILFFADYLAVLCAEQLSFDLRNILVQNHGRLYISKFNFYIITPFLYIIFLQICGLYTRKMQFWRTIAGIFKANIYAVLMSVFILYVVQRAATTSRLYVGMMGIFGFFFIALFRYIIKTVFDRKKLFGDPILLIGAGLTAAIILKYVKEDVGPDYHFVGYLEDYKPNPDVAAQLPCLGKFADAASLIDSVSADFFKCHRSYYINLGHVKKMGTAEVLMDNGDIIPISRGLGPAAKQKLFEYIRRAGR